jgi:nucleoid DNA-binding protein
MNELINLVSQKAGISQDQARTAVTAVLDFLKQRLPSQVSSQIDVVMSGQGGNAANVAKGVEGMLGKKS